MSFTPQRFVHVGFGNVVCANRIETILVPLSSSARRQTKAAKDAKTYLDLTAGRTTKALILMDDGKVFGCAQTPRTIAQRIQEIINTEGEESDYEDSEQECEVVEAD